LGGFWVLLGGGGPLPPPPAPLFQGEDIPDKGWLTVGEKPGFGLSLDPSVRLVPAVPGTRAVGSGDD
jgi:L-rhamnonate dehydratase